MEWYDLKKQKMLMEAGPFDGRICNHVDIVNIFYQDADIIQLTIYPDLGCWPHGHAYLPGGLIPTEFVQYTNVVEIKKTFDAHPKKKYKLYALTMKK